ncbi:pancreatic triacylglycerol lipase [Orussus abietinus]|uniref:pancreatic triacylglycerol lipase n=1 Tax=Orussus abietinus TaxID=222816 RepID=UPI000625785E|nr:pancreatic triacylglycerol lipase [Orussus abietinus]
MTFLSLVIYITLNLLIVCNAFDFAVDEELNEDGIPLAWLNDSTMVDTDNNKNRTKITCFALGSAVSRSLDFIFRSRYRRARELDVKFYFTSRNHRFRVEIMVGRQFGLEWVDFKIERRTVVITHGFLSHGNESWIRDLADAFIFWGDVNVIIVDWSTAADTWNYYKAVFYTKEAGEQTARFLGQLMNATIEAQGPDSSNWGPLHLVGHSLGAHVSGFAANAFSKQQDKWKIKRITGLDPAQPCFKTGNASMQLDRTDAPFVDIIHTNGRALSNLGLGLPEPIGHADFYPNGGKRQPGCGRIRSAIFDNVRVPRPTIQQAICSHGRSYVYLIESLITAAARNCTFWARPWDLTYRNAIQTISKPCTFKTCSEMGINAEKHPQRGTFFVLTDKSPPFCVGDSTDEDSVKNHLRDDLAEELED